MVLVGWVMVCSHRLSVQTIVVSGTVWPQFEMQVLIGVVCPSLWEGVVVGVGDKGILKRMYYRTGRRRYVSMTSQVAAFRIDCSHRN